MAYIRHKVIKGHVYYYLVEGRREGNKVRQKVLRYLGKHGALSASSGVAYQGLQKPTDDTTSTDLEKRQRARLTRAFKLLGCSVRHNLKSRSSVNGRVTITRDRNDQTISRTVSLRKTPKISTMCHELGHVIDDVLDDTGCSFWQSPQFLENQVKYLGEFESAGKLKYHDVLVGDPAALHRSFFQEYVFTASEGFANCFELFLTDYQKAKSVVPNMVAEFHSMIREHDDLRQAIEQLDVWTEAEADKG